MLLRKLREQTAGEEHEQDEYDEDEPRGRADDEEDEEDDEYEDEEEDDEGPRGQADEDDDGEEDYEDDEDEEDEPRGRADFDEDEEEDEEDEESDARSSSRSRSSGDEDDRGLASTVWEAVVEGVRSSQGDRVGKTSRARASDREDDEDDVSDREPRGASGAGRRKARAPRGNGHSPDHTDHDASSIVRQARRHLVELTSHEAESVSGLEREDGQVKVRCEVVELERIPHSTDVLATYELTLDEEGRLVDCRRVGRYTRSSAETLSR